MQEDSKLDTSKLAQQLFLYKIEIYFLIKIKFIKHNKMDKKQYKKSKFSRDKHNVCSEDDINRIDNKQNQWSKKRKEERDHNLKMASDQVVVEEPKSEEKIRHIRSDYTHDYAENVDDVDEEEEEIKYFPKMKLVMHNIPLSFNIDNVFRSFQYYGDIGCLNSKSNHTSPTYSVTAVPNEWNENIAEIQAEIEENGFAMIGDYKVTKE